MPRLRPLLLALLACTALHAPAATPALKNEQIDYAAFAKDVAAVGRLREARRVSEAEFIRMAREPGTVVLDARSERLFKLRHVAGAVNLSFPEFTQATLARIIPSRDTRVLIYCNNNFTGAPGSLPVKAVSAALNLSTFVSLHAYGYRNVYELGPVLDVKQARLAFEGDEVR